MIPAGAWSIASRRPASKHGAGSACCQCHHELPAEKWRKTVGVEPTGERLTPSTGFEARPHHRMSVLSAVLMLAGGGRCE